MSELTLSRARSLWSIPPVGTQVLRRVRAGGPEWPTWFQGARPSGHSLYRTGILQSTSDQPPPRETLDILIGETQLFQQTLAVHARGPFSVAQIVDFDRDFDRNVVRGMEPVAEPGMMKTRNHQIMVVPGLRAFLAS